MVVTNKEALELLKLNSGERTTGCFLKNDHRFHKALIKIVFIVLLQKLLPT